MMRKSILVLLGSVSIILCEQVNVDTTGSDSTGDGSVASPFRTIQFAIEHNNTSSGDIILVGPGTYTENINFRGKDITVGSLTLTTGDKSYVSETIIDGGSPSNSDSASVVTFIGGETSSAKLVGFTIQNGSGTLVSDKRLGGGIYTLQSSPSLKHLNIRSNTNNIDSGGGIYFGKNSDGSLDSSSVLTNLVTSDGGGLYIDAQSNVTIDSVLIKDNKAENGGGYSHPTRSHPTLNKVRIISNEAKYGGGIYDGGLKAKPKLYNVTVSQNSADIDGGGIYILQSRNYIEMYDLIVSDNVAGNKGGGIYIFYADATIDRASIHGNTAVNGGGIFVEGWTVNLTIVNALIYGNLGTGGTSAISVYYRSEVKIYHSTISKNTASAQATIYPDYGAKIYFYNSILWDNEAPKQVAFGDIGNLANTFEARNSIIQGLGSIEASVNDDVIDIDNSSFVTNPYLSNPMFNDFTLKNNSPAIGYGTNDASLSPNSTPVGVDYNSNSRPTDNNPDIGAHENSLNSPANARPLMDPPSDIEIDEDSGEKIVNLSGIADGDYHSEQSITVTATSDDTTLIPHPTVSYTSPEATGSVSFTPVPDTHGTVNLTVKVADNGGSADTGVDTLLTTFKVKINPIVPDNFKHVITNNGGVVQGTARLNGSVASPVDWIGAFDSSGNTVGSAPLVTSNNDVRFGVGGSNFILYGDDPTTSDVDEGMNQGEDFILKLWDASRNVVLIQVDSTGKPLTHSGWASTNFTPIDGYDDPTAIFDFYYNVDPVIEACLVTQLNEDTSHEFSINDLQYSDEDDISDNNLNLTIAAGEHYTINGTSLQPEKNYNGKIQVPFQISDGLSTSAVFTAEIEVLPVDDAPEVKNAITDFNILEDAPNTIINLSGTFTDVDNEDSDITKTVTGNSPSGKISTSVSGDTLTLDYLENQNGNVTITVEGASNGLTVDTSFTVNINAVNDPPVILLQDSTITVMEDSFIVIKSDYYTITDVDSEAPFSIVVQEGDNYTFSSDTLIPNYNYVGDLNVNVQPDDGQETDNLGPTFSSKITVLDKNDPPEVTSVTISPSIVIETDTLILSYSVSDPEGSTDTTVYISWYKNDVLVTEMNNSRRILPTLLSCDDTWFAEVVASDGLLSSDPVSSNKVTICKENTPPAWLDVSPIELTLLEDSDSVLFSMADFISDEEQALSQLTLDSDSMDVSQLIGASLVNGHFLSLSTLVEN
ncbi:MAG TPA: hypothetical protein EYO70_08815, partial [Candidatus Marinimicrobia bacterium]|nr:hypothetical protein [Candidatus Neomarinimicrobiota bacterium]